MSTVAADLASPWSAPGPLGDDGGGEVGWLEGVGEDGGAAAGGGEDDALFLADPPHAARTVTATPTAAVVAIRSFMSQGCLQRPERLLNGAPAKDKRRPMRWVAFRRLSAATAHAPYEPRMDGLAEDPRVPERVPARLRPDAEAVGAEADLDPCQ